MAAIILSLFSYQNVQKNEIKMKKKVRVGQDLELRIHFGGNDVEC